MQRSKRSDGEGTRGCESQSAATAVCDHEGVRVRPEGRRHDKPSGPGEAHLTHPARDGVSVRKGGSCNPVFVLSSDRQPLDPCSPARARMLLAKGRASVLRRFPFVIVLKDRLASESVSHSHRVKLDPGSKTTGMAIIREDNSRVVYALELSHRGGEIKKDLLARRALRRGRRSRHVRYRAARFLNRPRRNGWLPPSLQHRVETVMTWVSRFGRYSPMTAISMELVRFDLQKMENPEINGVEYQQGTLAGYETREYLLEKWRRKCAYCDAKDLPLQIEHVIARASGGSDRISNLTLACKDCNDDKGTLPIDVFLLKDPERLERIKAQLRAPLHDAAAVNATRWALWRRLAKMGLPVETGSGGRTKFNRTRLGLSKSHWADAVCVGASTPERIGVRGIEPQLVRATGHGTRRRCGVDRYGFPIRHAPAAKSFMGFKTGDLVRAKIPSGKYAGTHRGRIAIRHRPSFKLNGFDVHPRHLQIVQRGDGYAYSN